MTMSPTEIVDVLNELLETCYDGLEGFREAAKRVERPEAIALFESRVQRIDEAAAELYSAIRRHGGQPVTHGHREAFIHRGWMHLLSHAAPRGEAAVLLEVERGERTAVNRYRHAASKPLPNDLHDLVQDQLRGAEENLERVHQLRSTSQGTSVG